MIWRAPCMSPYEALAQLLALGSQRARHGRSAQ